MRGRGKRSTRLFRLVALVLVAAGAWCRPAVARAQAEIPPEVRQALERNARSFAPITLKLEKQRTVPQPPTSLTKVLLETDPTFLKPYSYEYVSQDGRCYAHAKEWSVTWSEVPGPDRGKKKLIPRWSELAWDGKSAYRGAEYLEPKILSILPIEKVDSDPEFKNAMWYVLDDYFVMTGIALPFFMKELPEGPQSEVLRLLNGDGRVTETRVERLAGGTDHFVVELLSGDKKKHRFWLDPSMGHAVRRHEVWAASGALAVVMDNSDFVKLTGPELWLPRHCHAVWHSWPWIADKPSPEVGAVTDIQATQLERANVPPEKFVLRYDKPGTLISDARLPGAEKGRDGRIDYLVPSDPGNLEEAIRAAQEKHGYVPPRRALFVWIVVGSIAIGAVAGGIVLIRRRRGRRTTP
jgi:hypothetical protein